MFKYVKRGSTVNTETKKRLHRYRDTMRKITEKSVKIADRRKMIQKGGFLSAILGAGIPLLIKGISALVTHISNKKRKK